MGAEKQKSVAGLDGIKVMVVGVGGDQPIAVAGKPGGGSGDGKNAPEGGTNGDGDAALRNAEGVGNQDDDGSRRSAGDVADNSSVMGESVASSASSRALATLLKMSIRASEAGAAVRERAREKKVSMMAGKCFGVFFFFFIRPGQQPARFILRTKYCTLLQT